MWLVYFGQNKYIFVWLFVVDRFLFLFLSCFNNDDDHDDANESEIVWIVCIALYLFVHLFQVFFGVYFLKRKSEKILPEEDDSSSSS